MNHLSMGWLTLAFAFAFAGSYLIFYQVRRFSAWVEGTAALTERVMVKAVVVFIVGAITGTLAQTAWNDAQPCRDAGTPMAACLFLSHR